MDDNRDITQTLAAVLRKRGYEVEVAYSAMEGFEVATRFRPGVALLDIGLPDLDGTELLRMIRAVSEVPIIVITARGADEVVVRTLDAGADDYLVKPFSVAQLEARVRALLRRGSLTGADDVVQVGGLRIDQAAREAQLDGRALDLSPKEFDLLRVLAERAVLLRGL